MSKILTIAFIVGGIFIIGVMFLAAKYCYRSVVKTLNKYTYKVNSEEEEDNPNANN